MRNNVKSWRVWLAASLGAASLLPAATAWAAAIEKTPSLVMEVFLGDKPVGETEFVNGVAAVTASGGEHAPALPSRRGVRRRR